jgi:hypothetical protein
LIRAGLSPAATELTNLIAAHIRDLDIEVVQSLIDQIKQAASKRRR